MNIKLVDKLSEIQSKLNCPKIRQNSYLNYFYRNCEDILEAVKPFIYEMKVAIKLSDEIINIGNRFFIKSTAKILSQDESIESHAFAEIEISKKGLDASQICGLTSSYARKYALNGLLAIDDCQDSDSREYKKTEKQYIDEFAVKFSYYEDKIKGSSNIIELQDNFSEMYKEIYPLSSKSETINHFYKEMIKLKDELKLVFSQSINKEC